MSSGAFGFIRTLSSSLLPCWAVVVEHGEALTLGGSPCKGFGGIASGP